MREVTDKKSPLKIPVRRDDRFRQNLQSIHAGSLKTRVINGHICRAAPPHLPYQKIRKKMRKRSILLAVIISMTITGIAAAAALPNLSVRQKNFIREHGDLPISSIKIMGLERTSESVVLNRLSVKKGKPLSSFDTEYAMLELQRLRLFHDIHIDFKPNGEGVNIIAFFREKHTIIPLPYAIFAGKYQSYGLYLLDMNFLGLGKKFFGGGSYSPQGGWKVQVGYIDPEICSSSFVLSGKIIVGDELFENRMPGEEIFQRFEAFHFLSEFTFGYRVLKNHTFSSLSVYRLGETGSTANALGKPPSIQVFYQGLRYKYRNNYFKKGLAFGWTAVAEYTRGIPLKGEIRGHNQSRILAAFAFPVFRYHRVSLTARGGAGKLPPTFEERIGGTIGFKTLPRNEISADYFSSGTVTYEYPFWSHRLVTVSATLSWEQGFFKKDDLPVQNCYGPGAGFRLYLKRIAIPAVGLDVVYNIAAKEYLFAGSVGVTM